MRKEEELGGGLQPRYSRDLGIAASLISFLRSLILPASCHARRSWVGRCSEQGLEDMPTTHRVNRIKTVVV